MAGESRREDVVASAAMDAAADRPEAPRLSRRQAIGRMSAVASAGVAAWVVPEILTAKPASAGAVLSGTTAEGTADLGALPATSGSTKSTSPKTTEPLVALGQALATTGLDLERDAAIGAALVAGGWAMHYWASRPDAAADGAPGRAPGATNPASAE
jgi:hypothetical protein